MNFKLGSYEGPVTMLQYNNGRTAFSWNTKSGEPIATITVNLPDERIASDEVAIDINNMSYIGEVITQLKAQGFITDHVRDTQSGFVNYPVYKVTQEVLDLI